MNDEALARKIAAISPEERREALRALELLAKRQKYNRLAYFTPYPKQWEFIELTAEKREAALFAGNQVGKSDTGAFITACHATGRYPEKWKGQRFDKRDLRIWVAGPSGMSVRDVEQKKLFGQPGVLESLGTGMIPRDAIIGKPSSSRSASDAFDTAHIRHVNGSVTALSFRTYDQKRDVWQGDPVDFIWCDEEPPADLYSEAQARGRAVQGSIICTFTPLEGMTRVAPLFIYEASPLRGWLRMAMLDAGHFTEKDVEEARQSYPRHEWEARIDGYPKLGSGRVYTADETNIRWVVPGRIPDEWLKIAGVDFGIDHPFGYALCAWDRDTDTFYVLNGFRLSNALIMAHAQRIRAMGGNVPVAWPHDGHTRDRQSGETIAAVYRKEGLLMLDEHAKLSDGSNSLYGTVNEINEWMNAGRWRVNDSLSDWFQEYGTYHYKDGVIVPVGDDFLSATRYAWMMRRRGKAGPIQAAGPVKPERRRPGTEFDLWTGKPIYRDDLSDPRDRAKPWGF